MGFPIRIHIGAALPLERFGMKWRSKDCMTQKVLSAGLVGVPISVRHWLAMRWKSLLSHRFFFMTPRAQVIILGSSETVSLGMFSMIHDWMDMSNGMTLKAILDHAAKVCCQRRKLWRLLLPVSRM